MKTYLYQIIILLLLLTSCDPQMMYEENINIDKNKWNLNQICTFSPQITDTLSICNLFINVRNTGNYPKSNLWLFIDTYSPLGYSVRDTFECKLSDNKGKWLGKGFGNIWENKFLYKSNIRFPHPGKYSFTIQQAMRIENLPGIIDVGFRIEKQ